jgi:hypothetical protein
MGFRKATNQIKTRVISVTPTSRGTCVVKLPENVFPIEVLVVFVSRSMSGSTDKSNIGGDNDEPCASS